MKLKFSKLTEVFLVILLARHTLHKHMPEGLPDVNIPDKPPRRNCFYNEGNPGTANYEYIYYTIFK